MEQASHMAAASRVNNFLRSANGGRLAIRRLLYGRGAAVLNGAFETRV